jgi:hypothetical protein
MYMHKNMHKTTCIIHLYPLAPASSPPVVNWVNMWPLGWQLGLCNSCLILMPICCLLAHLSPPHLRPPILLATVHTLLPPASTPPVVIFVWLTRNGASALLNPVKMRPPRACSRGCSDWFCVCRQNTCFFSDNFFAEELAPKKWEQIEKSLLLRICDSIK